MIFDETNKSININGDLIIEIIDNNGKPWKIKGNIFIVKLSNGTPVVVVSKIGNDDTYLISRIDDKDFNNIINDLGLDITEIHIDDYYPNTNQIIPRR